jgi:hypothetical protein
VLARILPLFLRVRIRHRFQPLATGIRVRIRRRSLS